MLTLSEVDLELFEELRRVNVLEDVEPHRLNIDNGVVLASCGDGDRIYDIFTHMGRVLERCGSVERRHLVALNGGPLIAHPKSPLAEGGDSEVTARHIRKGAMKKGTAHIAMCAHAPCAIAYDTGLNLAQVIDLLKKAQLHLEGTLPDLRFHPFVQIALPNRPPDRQQRTYFVSGTRWSEWCASNSFRSLIE